MADKDYQEVDVEEIVENQEDVVTVESSSGSGARASFTSRTFKADDYLTIVIRKQLDLPEDWKSDSVKVSWEDIEAAYNALSTEKKAEKADWWSFMERNRNGRMKRYEILEEALVRHGLEMRGDSHLCRKFVHKNEGDKREIVKKMYVMNLCHKEGAPDKFKTYVDDLKEKNPTAVRADRYVALRDMFFDRFYQDFILQNPDREFRWKPHPGLIAAQEAGTLPPRQPSNRPANAPFRGRGSGTFRGRGRGGFTPRDNDGESQQQTRGGFAPRGRGRGGFAPRGRGTPVRGFAPRGRPVIPGDN